MPWADFGVELEPERGLFAVTHGAHLVGTQDRDGAANTLLEGIPATIEGQAQEG